MTKSFVQGAWTPRRREVFDHALSALVKFRDMEVVRFLVPKAMVATWKLRADDKLEAPVMHASSMTRVRIKLHGHPPDVVLRLRVHDADTNEVFYVDETEEVWLEQQE